MHPLDNEALKLGAKAVRRRRLDAENRQDFISLLGRVVVILLCAWVLFTQVFLLTQAKGSSMFPAVKDGDLLICYRLQKTYAKNDVVVYTQGGKLRVRIQQLLGAVDLLRRQTLGKVRAQAQPLGKKAPLGRAPRAAVPQLAGALHALVVAAGDHFRHGAHPPF